MKIIELSGYSDHVPRMAMVVDKIVAVAVWSQDLNKTAIWVDGIETEFVSSDSYTTVMDKISGFCK